MKKILEVKNIEKYYGNKSNLTKAIEILALMLIKVNLLELWELVALEKQHY